MPSLNAKLKAWVGKYRRILVKFPRQNALNPCSDETRLKQLTIPVYQATSPEIIFGFASWVWIKSFTRSIGAVHVLATAPDVPPARKLIRKSLDIMTNLFCEPVGNQVTYITTSN